MMSAPETKVDMAQLRKAVRKVFAFKPPPKREQEQYDAQRKDSQPLLVKEPQTSCYKADKQ